MRFVVQKAELNFESSQQLLSTASLLNSSTSVNYLKAHFFETIASLGQIIIVDESYQLEQLKLLCLADDVVVVYFHEAPLNDLSCRVLMHSMGSLMICGGFMHKWTFGKSVCNVVTSQIQAQNLKTRLGDAAPIMCVFPPKLNTNLFRLPSETEVWNAKAHFSVSANEFHIVYAGRLIANKGISQVVRALNIFKEHVSLRITIVGDFETDFYINQSHCYNTTFPHFFEREVISHNIHCSIQRLPSMRHEQLRQLFWSADCFVYASFHEDENFGITPREAMLCGVPVVATDFCGLGALKDAKCEILKTYPTLAGIRFSVKELAEKIYRIWNRDLFESRNDKKFNSIWVQEECNVIASEQLLKLAVNNLLDIPVSLPPVGGWRSKERFDNWMAKAPVAFKQAVANHGKAVPDGLFVDGTGNTECEWFSEPYFMKAIQGLYLDSTNKCNVL